MCRCGGEGSIRLGPSTMSLASLMHKLKACVVPREVRDEFLSKWNAAGHDLVAKQKLLHSRRMASMHKVKKTWGPVTLTDEGKLHPAPSPMTRMHKGNLTFSSPRQRKPSPVYLALREAILGPESVKSFQYPASGAFKKKVSSDFLSSLSLFSYFSRATRRACCVATLGPKIKA